MVTANDHFQGVTRVSREKFARLLRERAAPAVLAERDPREYWDECRRWGVDPLFILAMFLHESSMGKAGTATQTKSWGNTRAPCFGPAPLKNAEGAIVMIAGRSGWFPAYATWRDGCGSTAARLVEPSWYYAGRTIGQVFTGDERNPDKVWAPAGDLNNPSGYLRAVLDYMTAHEEARMIPMPPMQYNLSPNRGGYPTPRRVDAVVWHITDGTNSIPWLTNPISDASSNYHIARNGVITELVPPWENAWTNGDAKQPNTANPLIARWVAEGANFNTRTISIEHEARRGEGLTTAQAAASVHLTAWLLQEYGLPREDARILGHNEINKLDRPYCPGFPPQVWGAQLDRVYAMFDAPAPQPPPPPAPEPPPPAPDPLPLPHNVAKDRDNWVCHAPGWTEPVWVVNRAFLDFYLSEPRALQYFGLPIGGMFTGGGGREMQDFERARFEDHGGRVELGLVNAERLDALGIPRR